MTAQRFDAVVVGLGAAGVWAAKALCEKGLRVAALDAGPRLRAVDLPGEIPPASFLSRAAAFRQRIQSKSISFHPALAHLYVDDKDNPYQSGGEDPFMWIRGRQVGGRLHTWARLALRMAERDFAHGWPIGYEELAPYYDRIESFHGLRGAVDGIETLPDGVVSEFSEFTEPSALFKRRVEERWPERRVIQARVLGQEVEPLHAPLRCALATGRLELLAEAPVSRVLMDEAGERALGVEFVDAASGERHQLLAERVFLCASSIESVRLLLNSRCARHPQGLGNGRDQLGRYLMDHNLAVAQGPVGDDYRPMAVGWVERRSTPLDLSLDLDFYIPSFAELDEGRGFDLGFGMQGMITPSRWGMATFGEMQAHPDNRVTASERVDAHGIPTIQVSIRRGDNDQRMIEAQQQAIEEVCEVADLPIKMPMPAPVRPLLWRLVGPQVGVMYPGLAIHECGGARMGDDPAVSVVNQRNQLWDVPNLYVTDGACFPSTGCQNPTLTIMALTLRACELAAESGN